MSLATQPGTPTPILNLGRRPYPDDKRVSHHRSNSIHNVFGFGFDFPYFDILRSDLLPKPCSLSNRHHHVVTPSKSTTPVPTSTLSLDLGAQSPNFAEICGDHIARPSDPKKKKKGNTLKQKKEA
ncbi:hypothetical protein ACFE04_024191 [Oxalis oulophora]